MKGNRYTAEQKIRILREAESSEGRRIRRRFASQTHRQRLHHRLSARWGFFKSSTSRCSGRKFDSCRLSLTLISG